MHNDRVIEVIVDNEIVKSNTTQEDARMIKNRALVKGSSNVRIVIDRTSHRTSYIFKNKEDYKGKSYETDEE